MRAFTWILISSCLWPAGCYRLNLDRSLKLGEVDREVKVEQVPVRGFILEVEYLKRGYSESLTGELLAVTPSALFLAIDSGTVRIPRSDLTSMELVDLFPSQAPGIGLWTGLGATTTLSHGFLAIITAPLWLIVGTSCTISAANSNDLEVELRYYDKLYQFARFPQGMPQARQSE